MRNLILLPLLLLCLSSCLKDDDYSTSTADKLTFSTDTLAFDTIFSGTPSSTSSFTVKNPNDKALRITDVRLKGGVASAFRVNVDGTPLVNGTATDFEIAAKDTMLVYVFACPDDNGDANPVPVEDELTFQMESGIAQSVVLQASGQSVIPLQGHVVEGEETLGGGRPYLVKDSLVVSPGAKLAIQAGTCLYFHAGASLIVHGTLLVQGTSDEPVVLRGDRLDNMFTNQPYDRIPGQWGGVVIASDSRNTKIAYADIHSGDFGIRVDSTDLDHTALVLENSVVHTIQHHALETRMAKVEVGNSQITNAGSDCVHIRGGEAHFVHCTIARFYVFSGGSGVALSYANYDGKTRLPLSSAAFENCIITGYQSDEVMGAQNPDHKRDAFNYSFRNCLLNTPEPTEADNHIVDCLWDDGKTDQVPSRDKNFSPEFDLSKLLFSFQLNRKSKAVGTADASISASSFPADRLGRPRTGDNLKPDMGCYQSEPESSDQ